MKEPTQEELDKFIEKILKHKPKEEEKDQSESSQTDSSKTSESQREKRSSE